MISGCFGSAFFRKKIIPLEKPRKKGRSCGFLPIFARFLGIENMKRFFLLVLASCFCFFGCNQQQENAEVLHREFFENQWERFDFVRNNIEVKSATTYNLGMRISFTDNYPYDDFSMVFTVFTDDDEPYRSKGYKFNLKDADGHWNADLVEGCYTFDLPINKALQINEPGTYCFQIENQAPVTPLIGVKELTLYRN